MSMQLVQRSFGVRLFAAGFAVVALIGLSLIWLRTPMPGMRWFSPLTTTNQ